MKIKTGRMKELQVCACGCGRKAQWHRLHLLRGPDHGSFFVLDECRGAFADELVQWGKIHAIHKALAGTFFWQRWRAAKAWYILQFALRARLLGADRAAMIARCDTLVFMAPGWLARLYVWWKPGRERAENLGRKI
jgi:hypothetical protein